MSATTSLDSPPASLPATVSKPRFVLIDAMRGFGALGVMIYHLCVMSALTPAISRALGTWKEVLEVGQYGVQIFFVISGFVIAHTLRDYKPSRVAAWNFIIRRQLRLDPPYWAVLCLTLVLKWIGLRWAAGMDIQPYPTVRDIVLHFL